MEIRDRYKELTAQELTLQDFSKIVDLKKQCTMEMNREYTFLCDILIIDIYINERLFDDALAIVLKSVNYIDSVVFQKVYISFLERIIFIYIQKRNFKSAYRYAFLKRNYLDLDNVDEVNRWYLEMAYIYAELNQKDKALLNLKAILKNYPDEPLKALTLSNMTKLFIDDGLVDEAKKALAEGMKLVEKLKDSEGKTYCEYLNAKLFVLEKNYRLAKQSFADIFGKLPALNDAYLGYLNEYLDLLIIMELYDEVLRISAKYQKSLEDSQDLYLKKDYYRNLLKAQILREKALKEPLKPLLGMLEAIEGQLAKSEGSLSEESNEDDKNLEINNRLRAVISKIEKAINLVNLALLSDNERGCLMEFSKHLESLVGFSEALFVIFSKANFEILPDFFENFNKVNTYEYKKQRLYEREVPYNNLSGTVIEMLISSNQEIMMDLSDSKLPLKNLITDKPYYVGNVQSLIAIPLVYEKEIFACAVFTANDLALADVDAMALLKIACKLLEFKLISLFYQENLRSQKNILQITMDGLQEGMFYLDPAKSRLICTAQLIDFLKLSERMILRTDYASMVHPEDLAVFQEVEKKIAAGEAYAVNYRINVSNKEVHVQEKANPYISKEGLIKFYVGTIRKIEEYVKIAPQKTVWLGEEQFSVLFQEMKKKATNSLEYRFALARFQILKLEDYSPEIATQTMNYFYDVIRSEFSEQTYRFADGTFVSYLEISDQRVIDKKIRTILGKADQGVRYQNYNINFEVKVSLARFPRDSYNVEEIVHFTEMALKSPERYQPFSEEILKKYLKTSTITQCLKEQIRRNSIELLYLPLLCKEPAEAAFEVKYNVPGLLPKETISEFVGEKALIPFEILVIKSLFLQIKDLTEKRFYVHASSKTLDLLIKENFFKEGTELYQRIVVCIDDHSPYLEKIVNILRSLGFSVMINYPVFLRSNISNLFNHKIKGIFVYEAIESAPRSFLLGISKIFGYELLTNYDYPDYPNVRYKSDSLQSFDQITQK